MMTIVAFLAGSVIVVVPATTAWATEAPFFSVKGSRLKKGETRFLSAKATQHLVLKGGASELTCTTLKATVGSALLGSEVGEPGIGIGILEYSGCKTEGNGAKCTEVVEPIKTNRLKSELVEDTATKKKLDVEFFPVNAAGEQIAEFTKIIFKGTECEPAETKVEGEVVTEAFTDPPEGEPIAIELPGPVKESASFLLKVPATQPTKVLTGSP
jgi:hypothetical protein